MAKCGMESHKKTMIVHDGIITANVYFHRAEIEPRITRIITEIQYPCNQMVSRLALKLNLIFNSIVTGN